MKVDIIKFDNLGRGIGYINNKIIFIPKAIPGDSLLVEVVEEKKDYLVGKIISILEPSKNRIEPICPYFFECGGCDLMDISISNTLEYKLDKVNELLNKNNINYKIKNIIKSNNSLNYRNKITLKIINKVIGYYENSTHNIVSISECKIANKSINNILKDINKFNIIDGELIIRCNYKDELLLIINSDNKITNIDYIIDNYKISGIIQNDKLLYGDNYFIDSINNYLFKVSYDSFFQVNPFICSKIFDYIKDNTINSKRLLDFYCGVGTLGIVSSSDYSLGVEINENAIKDAFINKCLNKKDNIDFICSDTKKIIDKIDNTYDTIIFDPPRSGVDKTIIDKVIKENINKIIYVSCNPLTLVRDLKLLENNYSIKDITLFDMFPNTEHCESVTVLERR